MAASLLAPAAIGAASPAHRARPRSEIVRLVADPATVIAGDDVELKVAGGPPAGRYLWSVGGKRVATRQPALKLRLAAAGLVHVAVRIRAPGERVARARLTIAVRRRASVVRASDAVPRQRREHAVAAVRATRTGVSESSIRRAGHVRAAASSAVTISDFKFQASTVTINAGDTVTWTNAGPSQHTATASNGSFNTGPISKGQSASHTFATAGTYAYICSIHPFMHGTIIVRAAAASSTAPHSSATPTASAAPATQGSGLPLTGIDLIPLLVIGGGLAASGSVLRRRLAERDRRMDG